MSVIDMLSEEECYLWAILSDPSGIDQAEFCITDETTQDGCFRAWDFQWAWWRCVDPKQIEQGSRSSGKSLSVRYRALAFPFIHPGEEMVITAPEGNHLDALTDNIEIVYTNNRLPKEMLAAGRSGIKHRPFHMNFDNGARIMGRIPQRNGQGVKGCLVEGTPILTDRGYILVDDLQKGDLVLTHNGGWKPVRRVIKDVNDSFEVEGAGSFPLKVSCDHMFYGSSNRATAKEKRDLGQLAWFDVNELMEDRVYWATPTEFPHLDVSYPEFGLKNKELDVETAEFWWLVGLYLADGHLISQNGNRGRVQWTSHSENKGRNRLLECIEAIGGHYRVMPRNCSSADIVEMASAPMRAWLLKHFGQHADGKKMPAFVFSMKIDHRQALLDGYLAGDGHWQEDRRRWETGSASQMLSLSVQMLAQSLGYKVGCSVIQPNVTSIMGVPLKSKPKLSWRLRISERGNGYPMDGYLVHKVKKLTPIGKQVVYNPIVDEEHSYLSGSIMSHNLHPIWLELDEGQDYYETGWNELVETVKQFGEENQEQQAAAQWRAHGVTRGPNGKFYEFTKPEKGWTIHHYPAMYRPTWSDAEREDKIKTYGHRDSPDFRRNVYGMHGDSGSPLFVLHRLMESVDVEVSSNYNQNEYWHCKIEDAAIREKDGDPISLLDPPGSHLLDYKVFWIGMDVGFTLAPSAITIFAEVPGKKAGEAKLKLIGRLMLWRVGTPDQVKIMLWLIRHYRPEAFAMDSTGAGLPLYQQAQEDARNDPSLIELLGRIRGYNFSSKIPVEFDDKVDIDENDPLGYEAALIKRPVLEYSSDVLRGLVDAHRLILPWDQELIGEYRGEMWTYVTGGALDLYGRKKSYANGSLHTLDASRMAALAWKQAPMEEFLRQQQAAQDVPVETIILDW